MSIETQPVSPPVRSELLPTPWTWRLSLGLIIAVLVGAAYLFGEQLGPRFRAGTRDLASMTTVSQ